MTGAARKEAFTSIPVIDFSALYSQDQSKVMALAEEVFTACRDVGFFYAAAHGIDGNVMKDAFQNIQQFFALPDEKKMEVHFHKSPFFRGYECPFDTRHETWGKEGTYFDLLLAAHNLCSVLTFSL